MFMTHLRMSSQQIHVAHYVHPFSSTAQCYAHPIMNWQESNIALLIIAH